MEVTEVDASHWDGVPFTDLDTRHWLAVPPDDPNELTEPCTDQPS